MSLFSHVKKVKILFMRKEGSVSGRRLKFRCESASKKCILKPAVIPFENDIFRCSAAKLLIVFSVLFIIILTFYVISNEKRKTEENAIINDINSLKLFKYSKKTLYSDLQILLDLSEKKYSDSFKGFIYERISFVYRCMGENLNYYTYLGKALYYLEKSKNYQTMLNLYIDLIDYQYIPNGNYDLVQQILYKIDEIEKEEGITEARIKTSVYRIKGDLAYHSGKYELASQMYDISKKTANEAVSYIRDFFLPIVSVHEARNLIELGKYEEAEYKIRDLIQENQSFDNYDYPFGDVIIKLIVIPLEQVKCCLNAHSADYENLKVSIEKLVDYAYKQSFERMALITLQKLKNDYQLPDYVNDNIQKKIENLYSVIYLKNSKSYTDFCSSQINSTVLSLEEAAYIKAEEKRSIVLITSLSIAIIVLGFLYVKIKRKSYMDDLTGIYNRRYLSRKILKNEKRQISYSVIMLDIDDFKHINDTYGHDAGDIVLHNIGEILSYRSRPKKIEAFRYGGEEFALIIYETESLSPLSIAESVRREIMEQDWYFNELVTVSIGVADKSNTEKDLSILKQADIFLYHAKKHGKNQVCNGINSIYSKANDKL